MQEETQQQKLGERGLGDILNETFAVYGRRFKKLVALTAVVYLPLLIIPLLLLKPGDPNAESATMVDMVMMVIVVVAGMISYGAMTSAVGQHYVLDEVSVSGCYTRLLWRAVSILLLVSLAVLLLMLVFAPLLFTSQDGPSPLVLFSLAILVVFIAYWVYQTSMIPAVTVEGYRFFGGDETRIQTCARKRVQNLGALDSLCIGWAWIGDLNRFAVLVYVRLGIRGRVESRRRNCSDGRILGCRSLGSTGNADRDYTSVLRPPRPQGRLRHVAALARNGSRARMNSQQYRMKRMGNGQV